MRDVAGAAAAIVIAASALVAARAGGAFDRPAAPPRAAPGGPAAASSAAPGDAYATSVRLVDALRDARADVPTLRAASPILDAHWRKMQVPWTPLAGDAARLAWTIALRTSATEEAWVVKTPGLTWRPDPRVWNLNEASFDQREAIVAPAPATIAFRLTLPIGARLAVAPGTLNVARDAVLFRVVVIDARGAEHEAWSRRVPPAEARRWIDASIDLSAFGGQPVELRLVTATSPATDDERAALRRVEAAAALAARESAAREGVAKEAPPRDASKEAASKEAAAKDAASKEAASKEAASKEAASKEAAAKEPSKPPPSKEPAASDAAAKERADEAILARPAPQAVALWGDPTIESRATPTVPYDVLWIVVDALRPDAIASLHDDAEDAAKLAAPTPPLEALLPRIDGLTPSIDALAARAVRFTHAWSAASWTRPGTLAMLAGERSSELGIDTLRWPIPEADAQRYYASDPPLLPLLLRRRGVVARAFVNNAFMSGYTPIGLDMGFPRVVDHRHRTRDTAAIAADASAWMRDHRDTRFFLFCNFDSPHEPLEPPPDMLARVPPPPRGPRDPAAREYLGEVAKDDAAIGALLRTLDEIGLTQRTIVVITSDHGETISTAHTAKLAAEHMPMRFHHAASMFEETTRVPIVVSLPSALSPRAVTARVRSVDLAPTILELEGIEASPRASGRSLVALARGAVEPDERPVVSEGRGTRALLWSHFRYVAREGMARKLLVDGREVNVAEELYDLDADPGERRDLAAARPELAAEMRARLEAAWKNVAVAGSRESHAPPAVDRAPVVRLRFAGAGAAHRVSGTITAGDPAHPPAIRAEAVGAPEGAARVTGGHVEIALDTAPDGVVGVDLRVDPPDAPLRWDFTLDDAPWPADHVYAGPWGLLAPSLAVGIASDEARAAADADAPPFIDPAIDRGLFVTRASSGGAAHVPSREGNNAAAAETTRMLRAWGYAQGAPR